MNNNEIKGLIQKDIRSITEKYGIKKENVSNILDYIVDNIVLPDWNSTGTYSEILNKPTKLSQFENDLDLGIKDVSSTESGIVNNTPLQELGGVDKTINGVRIGRGALNEDGSTVFGRGALSNPNLSGGANSAFGEGVLMGNTTGARNVGIGGWTLYSNTTGDWNSALGDTTLPNNTTGTRNVAVGTSLYYNTVGSRNTGVGFNAGFGASTGSENTYIGNSSGYNNGYGSYNVSIGSNSLITNGIGSTASTLSFNRNVFIGVRLITADGMSDTLAIDNKGTISTLASDSLIYGGFSKENRFVNIGGRFSITPSYMTNATISHNKRLVYDPNTGGIAVKDDTTEVISDPTKLDKPTETSTLSDTTFNYFVVVDKDNNSKKVAISELDLGGDDFSLPDTSDSGLSLVSDMTIDPKYKWKGLTLSDVTSFGNYVGDSKWITFSTDDNKVPTREFALGVNPNSYSFFFGGMNSAHTGYYNVGIGYDSLAKLTSGNYNTAVGLNSMANNTLGEENVAIGALALGKMTGTVAQSRFNVAVGLGAGRNILQSSGNVFIGRNAGGNLTSEVTEDDISPISPIALEYMKSMSGLSGYNSSTKSFNSSLNTFVGADAGYYSSRVANRAAMSIILGASPLVGMLHRNYNNIIIGSGNYSTLANSATYNSIIIGNCVNLPNQVDALAIGMSRSARTDSNNAIIYGELPNKFLHINAPLKLPRIPEAGTNHTRTLVSNSSGDVAWKTTTERSDDYLTTPVATGGIFLTSDRKIYRQVFFIQLTDEDPVTVTKQIIEPITNGRVVLDIRIASNSGSRPNYLPLTQENIIKAGLTNLEIDTETDTGVNIIMTREEAIMQRISLIVEFTSGEYLS